LLLARASETGLLTPHGGGTYTIHPALPWFFKTLFDQSYTAEPLPSGDPNQKSTITNQKSALRAFVESLGALGDYYHSQYQGGNREVIAALRAEEANLLYARTLALSGLRQSQDEYDWSSPLTGTMQGLRILYDHTGRRAEWQRLVDEIVPDFVGADDLPLPGREEQWSLVTEYRVRLAQESRDWPAAERLQRVQVDEQRRNAAALLARPPESLSANEKNSLRTLAVSMQLLGRLQSQSGKTECVETYKDGYELSLKIGNQSTAVTAFNLGHAYLGNEVPALRDLDAAESWYQRSLDLRAEGDRVGRGKCLITLGNVAYERFRDAKQAGESNEALGQHLQTAADYYGQALSLLPPDAVNDLAVAHNQLGNIYNESGDLERALYHYNQDIYYDELAGNQYGAGITRRNIAIVLANNGRPADALLYARAALRNFEPYGQGAAEVIERTKSTIAWIEGLGKQ
jgi:tetratricopeptide (TPR) repeat protein